MTDPHKSSSITKETSAQQIELTQSFRIDHLRLIPSKRQVLSTGQIRVKLSHSALNYRDLMMVKGQYNPRQALPLVPCSDGAGVITESFGNSQWNCGERVIPLFSQNWIEGSPGRHVTDSTLGGPLQGTLRSEAIFDENGVVEVPSYLSNAEASTLGCAALTAWSALVELGKIKNGDQVLCIGTGGVSLFAAQIAAMLGAKVVLISRSIGKLEQVMNHPEMSRFSSSISPMYTPSGEQWGASVKKNFGEIDHVIEVGGAGTLTESLRVVKAGGVVSLIGVLAGGGGELNLTPVLMRQIRIQGVIVGHKEGLKRMLKAFETHTLRPIIDHHHFGFHEAREAFKYIESAQHIGKVVIQH